MPEGDTVWLTAKRLHAALSGRVVTTFEIRVPKWSTANLIGDRMTDVVARGKHLFMRFESGLSLHSHLRMDGSWHIVQDGRRAPLPPHQIRALIGNDRWMAIGRRVHDLEILKTADEQRLVGHLGPDLLAQDWDADEAVRRLLDHPDRPVGEALLDQRNLAGLGNLYKSEVLFLEGVDPRAPVGDVAHVDRLVDTAHRLINANRDHPEQSTTGLIRRGEQHWVYQRGGRPCRRCGTTIQRLDQGAPPDQRSTFWCPNCQAG